MAKLSDKLAAAVCIVFALCMFVQAADQYKFNPFSGKLDNVGDAAIQSGYSTLNNNYSTHAANSTTAHGGINTAFATYTGIGDGRAVLRRQATFGNVSANSFSMGTSRYDAVNNRLGIGTNAPTNELHVKGSGAGTTGRVWLKAETTNISSAAGFLLQNSGGKKLSAQIGSSGYTGGESAAFYTEGSIPMSFVTDGNVISGGTSPIVFSVGGYSASTERMRLTTTALTTPTINGATTEAGTLTLRGTSHSTTGQVRFGTSGKTKYDEPSDTFAFNNVSTLTAKLHTVNGNTTANGVWSFIKSLATTAYNNVVEICNNLITKGNQAAIAFMSKDEVGTSYQGAAISTVFSNHSTNKQSGYLAFDLVSSAATVGFKRKMTIDSNGVTTINGTVVIGGDSSGITFANRSSILSGYIQRNTVDTLAALNGATNGGLGLAQQNMTYLDTGFETPGSWQYGATLGSGTYNTDLGGLAALLINPTYNYAAGSTSASTDLKISRTETSLGTGVDYLIDAGINNSGHKSVATIDNKGRAIFRQYTSGALTGSEVSISDLGIRLKSTATTWNDLRIEPVAKTGGLLASPAFSAWAGTSDLFAYGFNDNPGTLEYLFYALQMSHDWREGSAVQPHVHFSTAATTGTVKFRGKCYGANYTGTFASFGNWSSTTTLSGAAWKHNIGEGSTVDMTGKTISSIMNCNLTRDYTVDTAADDAFVHYIDYHYQTDSMGSDTEYSKTATP